MEITEEMLMPAGVQPLLLYSRYLEQESTDHVDFLLALLYIRAVDMSLQPGIGKGRLLLEIEMF